MKLEAVPFAFASKIKYFFWSTYFRKLATVIGFCWPKRATSILPRSVKNSTASVTSGSEKALARSIELGGAPAYSVKSAIWLVTTGGTVCAETENKEALSETA